MKRPLEAKDLYRLRLISDPKIAPEGNRVAFVLKQMSEEKNDYVSNVYVVSRDGEVVQFTNGDKDSSPRWSPDGKHLAFLSGRKDRAQIHLLSASGGESVPLTDRKLGAGVPVWSPDSSAIAFAGAVSTDPNEEKDEESDKKDPKRLARTKIVERANYKLDAQGYIGNRRSHVFCIDVASRTVEQLTEGDHNDSDPSWSPDSACLAFTSGREDRWDVTLSEDIYIVARTGGAARRLTEHRVCARPVFAPDGERIAFAAQPDPEDVILPAKLFSIDLTGDDYREESRLWDGELRNGVIGDVVQSDDGFGLTWRRDGIYFVGTERGESNVYRSSGGTVAAITRGAHAITDFSLTKNDALAYTRADSTHLAEVYLRESGDERQLTSENDAFLDEVLVFTPERFQFAGANGDENDGRMIVPLGHDTASCPVLVYIHGGPQTTYGEDFFFEFQFLAGHGFGVFFPNIHGSSSYGADYQASIKADWGNLDFQDVMSGTKEIMKRPWVDPDRLGIIGGSYGGYMTLWVMEHTTLFKAAVAERCLSNFISFMGTSDGGWIWNRIAGAYPEEDVQKLWDMSPLKYLKHVGAPLMIMHSEGDDRTPLEQGEQAFLALRRLGKETKMIVFPEESHGLSRMGKPSRRVERLGYILEWFQKYLSVAPAPSQSDPAPRQVAPS